MSARLRVILRSAAGQQDGVVADRESFLTAPLLRAAAPDVRHCSRFCCFYVAAINQTERHLYPEDLVAEFLRVRQFTFIPNVPHDFAAVLETMSVNDQINLFWKALNRFALIGHEQQQAVDILPATGHPLFACVTSDFDTPAARLLTSPLQPHVGIGWAHR